MLLEVISVGARAGRGAPTRGNLHPNGHELFVVTAFVRCSRAFGALDAISRVTTNRLGGWLRTVRIMSMRLPTFLSDRPWSGAAHLWPPPGGKLNRLASSAPTFAGLHACRCLSIVPDRRHPVTPQHQRAEQLQKGKEALRPIGRSARGSRFFGGLKSRAKPGAPAGRSFPAALGLHCARINRRRTSRRRTTPSSKRGFFFATTGMQSSLLPLKNSHARDTGSSG